jgi:cobalt-precorrin 5A hydrolase
MGLIEVSLLEQRLSLSDITALASIESKSNESGLLEVAELLRLPLGFFSADELIIFDKQLSHRSQIVFDVTGCYGVAESTALAMASRLTGKNSRLLIQRRASSRATFALAECTSL